MATNAQQLQFAIRAVNEAKTALKDVSNDIEGVQKAAHEAEKATGGFKGALGDVAKIAGGFVIGQGIVKAPGFLLDAAKAAAEDEAATMRLEQALRNLGGNFDEHLKDVNAAIDAGQKLAFSDDEIRDSYQALAAATGDHEEALRRQKAAMDLARGANIPLAQATKMLGKLNEENVEVFKKLGITLGDNANEAEALAAVQQKFGGQAEAYAKSTAGQFEILQLRIGEAKEAIGAALLPVMTTLGTVLATQIIPAFEAVATATGPALTAVFHGLQAAFGAIQPILLPLAAGIGAVAGVIVASMIPAALAWAAAEWAKVAALIASAAAFVAANAPLIAVALAVGLLVAGIVLLIQHWDEVVAKFPVLGTVAEGIKAKFDAFTGWITGTFVPAVQAIYTGVKDAVDKAIAFVRDHWDEIRAIIEPALEALVIIIETQWKLFQTVIETALGVIKGVVDVFMGIFTGDWERAWGGVKQVVESVWDGIRQTIETVIGAIKNLAPLIADAGKALGSALLDGLKSALSATAGFAGDVAGAVLAAVKEIINTQVIDRINRTLEFSFDTKIPGIGTIHIDPFDIPHLAAGGIVTRPTLALIGEAGPEAVVPLSGPHARGGGVGTTVNITVQGSVWSLDELMYELQRRGVAV